MEALPLISELDGSLTAEEVFRQLANRPHCLFLDSALRHSELGRYSFVTADPFDFLSVHADGTDGLALLDQHLKRYSTATLPNAPPFQGGAAGLFSYDLARSLERVPCTRYDEFQIPALAVGLYDVVLAFDHLQEKAWIISQGLPETEPRKREERAAERMKTFERWLSVPTSTTVPNEVIPLSLPAQFPVGRIAGLTSSFQEHEYLAAVERAVDYIHAGDVFQVNLAQRLAYAASGNSVELYCRLRERNPATFAAYFDLGEAQIVSASPERFFQVLEGTVEARPIKGTRQRTARPEADLFAADELLESDKDRAENIMIVDLMRNDLSRVCLPESIQVTQLCHLEIYEFVQHLVSAVRGKLAPGLSAVDLLRASFPGGSITGAPKVRAMEIIAELEPTARGPYCGSLGYLGFNGAADLSILIRTITAAQGWWQFPVGGGIVAQSDPRRELEETWHKATGMLRALDL